MINWWSKRFFFEIGLCPVNMESVRNLEKLAGSNKANSYHFAFTHISKKLLESRGSMGNLCWVIAGYFDLFH